MINRKLKYYFSILVAISFCLHITSCKKKCKETCVVPINNDPEELIFNSGYESGTIGEPSNAHEDITGIDNSFTNNNDWVADLENHPNIGEFKFYYEDGDASQRYAKIIQEPNNPNNNVLQFNLIEAAISNGLFNKKGRISANLINNHELRDFYIKEKLYIPSDWNILKDYSDKIRWLTIQEFWNDLPEDDFPFRVTLNIQKVVKEHDDLHFGSHGQTRKRKNNWEDVWEVINTDYSIPTGEWITLETYFKEGDASNGEFKFYVTDQSGVRTKIIDINNFTYHPDACCPDGVSNFNFMKLYTNDDLIEYMRSNNKTLQLYWDDLELWINKLP